MDWERVAEEMEEDADEGVVLEEVEKVEGGQARAGEEKPWEEVEGKI